ncbi:acylneuraminate cytidylyltransferase family protein [Riemerella columbina]|uniref:acylneuraminate cytidylyltransferase family protein n=1 Tax=Riemerella columbina TaxID=103810 RepID=UPI00266F1864|nr:acylneuraminate cytidylyltransferase family protein [Riemerella columbina]WKS95151.1 acylneuraminate cytidylyltransferase family protein [Riemerella columbina]
MLALIPARGGSKGLPGKNIKNLNGKPLIAYTIEAALQAQKISRVVVNTDSPEIAEVAVAYGAEVPFMRSEALATDDARSIDVMRDAIERMEHLGGVAIPHFVLLQPTSPLRTAQHIDEAVQLFLDRNADAVISCKAEEHPIFWHKYLTEDGRFEEIFPNDDLKNRQDIRPTYCPNGAIYVFDKTVLQTEKYYTPNTYAYLMDRRHSIDIDTIEDFEYAEYIINKQW